MKKFAAILVLLTVVAMVVPVAAKAPEAAKDVYIVVMAADPAIAYEGGVEGLQPTKPGRGGKINPNSAHVTKYEKFLEKEHNKALEAVGASPSEKIHDYTIALNGFAAPLTAAQAEEMARQPGVALVLPDEMRYKTTENSPTFLGLTAEGGAWLKGYNGEGVVVGVIDTGIWPEHPSFADDGSYSRLPGYGSVPCEFGNLDHNPADVPFECNNKLIGARQMLDTYRFYIGADPDEFDSARDDDGHGTHTASTAAGNAGVEASIYGVPRGTVSGIAPRARIIAYKGLGNLGGFSSDLAAAIDQAVADGVDVINYSVGGGASLTGADDIAYLFAAGAGVFVATSNGNSGPGAGTVGGPASVPWLTSVGASTQNRTFQGSASSSDGWEFYGASITAGTDELPLVDAADAGDELCNPGALDSNVVDGKIVLCKRGAIARVAKSYAVHLAGGAGMILYNENDGQSEVTDNHWTPAVHINNTDGLVIKDYIANAAEPVAQINGGEFTEIPAPWMASFSSRGPNPVAGDIIKPDVTAPGVNILAGASPFPDPGFLPGELFQSISGTSMSSPHVAGVFALLKQAHPEWSPAVAKSAIMTTAYQDVMKEDGGTPADPFDMGSGHINPGGVWTKGSVVEPGLAYDAGFNDYLGFLCDAGPEVFADPAGTCAALEGAGIPTDASDLNYPSIGIAELAGSQTVQRTVTSVAKEQGWREYTVSVDAPEGYNVTVEPSTIRLKSGDSATYYVTITNQSGPIGEWRFGSLTWTDKTGNYDVYSPIAVRGALFGAPAAITGSGESGSASFDVTFGYTGSYSAAAHGLEPATVVSDNVVQDPDQSFDPNDGFSNRHDFTLSGAAFFRIVLPPDSVTDPDSIDLDVFVYDPNGVQVASSTNGGTDEQVDIVLPADGTWSVYVHGWQTAGPSADYVMYGWAVSATPGGNLSIDSAPASATIGALETIDLSWTGATAGQWHLGAVSHAGDVGLMGLTLVEVDNRDGTLAFAQEDAVAKVRRIHR
jgi:subtilisin family serine protease